MEMSKNEMCADTQLPYLYGILVAIPLAVKWLGCKNNHSNPTSTEVKDTWSYTSIPLCLHVMMA
jgi:hypothetical protein